MVPHPLGEVRGGLLMARRCCGMLFERRPRERGAVGLDDRTGVPAVGGGDAGWLAYTGGMSDGKEEREERERRRAEEKPWEREDRVERGEPEWEPEYGE